MAEEKKTTPKNSTTPKKTIKKAETKPSKVEKKSENKLIKMITEQKEAFIYGAGALVIIVLLSTVVFGELNDDKKDNKKDDSKKTESAEISSANGKMLFGGLIEEEAFQLAVENSIEVYIQKQQAEQQQAQAEQEAQRAEKAKGVPGIREGEHVYGDTNAEIVLFEYSDLECPFCKRFHPTTKAIAKSENIAIVFRHFPLDSLHPNARKFAEIGECVNQEGGNEAFWKYLDLVFDSNSLNPQTDIARLATQSGVDAQAVQDCVDAGTFATAVQKSVEEAVNLGMTGTPASVLKNVRTGKSVVLPGAVDQTYIKGQIQNLR